MNPRLIGLGLKTLDRWWPTGAAMVGMKLFLSPRHYPRPAGEEKLWHEAETLTVPSGRVWKRFGRHGGPRVAFLHGWESRGSVFHSWFGPFAEAGFEILAWDGPAHGDSPGSSTNLFEYSLALGEDLRSLGAPPDVLIGHSFGGAAVMLSQLLGAVGTRVSVVVGSPDNVGGVIERSSKELGLSVESQRRFRRLLERRTGVDISQADFSLRARELPANLLLVHDRRDKEVPFEEAERLARAGGFEFLVTEGLGHRRILHDRELILRILDKVRARLTT